MDEKMKIIHTGFDGIDLAIETKTPPELVNFLEEGKAMAQDIMADAWGQYADRDIQIGQTGKRGGYAYTFRVYGFGAVWFAKKPRAQDPWGIFVSIGSRELALHGQLAQDVTLHEPSGDSNRSRNTPPFPMRR
jgi:hypothetical protein